MTWPVHLRRAGSKYTAKRTVQNGIKHASKGEAQRYAVLVLMEKGKLITDLRPHPRYPLVVNGLLVGHFSGDAEYLDHGVTVCEDHKGVPGDDTAYRLRRRLFQALYPQIKFREHYGTGIIADIEPPKPPSAPKKKRTS